MAVPVCRVKIAVAHKAHERERINPALNRSGAVGVTAIVELEGWTNFALCQSLFVSIPELCHGPVPIRRPEAPTKWEDVVPLRLRETTFEYIKGSLGKRYAAPSILCLARLNP